MLNISDICTNKPGKNSIKSLHQILRSRRKTKPGVTDYHKTMNRTKWIKWGEIRDFCIKNRYIIKGRTCNLRDLAILWCFSRVSLPNLDDLGLSKPGLGLSKADGLRWFLLPLTKKIKQNQPKSFWAVGSVQAHQSESIYKWRLIKTSKYWNSITCMEKWGLCKLSRCNYSWTTSITRSRSNHFRTLKIKLRSCLHPKKYIYLSRINELQVYKHLFNRVMIQMSKSNYNEAIVEGQDEDEEVEALFLRLQSTKEKKSLQK